MQLYTEHLGTAQVYVSERDSMFVLLQNPESSARSHFNGVYFEVGENSQIVCVCGGGGLMWFWVQLPYRTLPTTSITGNLITYCVFSLFPSMEDDQDHGR